MLTNSLRKWFRSINITFTYLLRVLQDCFNHGILLSTHMQSCSFIRNIKNWTDYCIQHLPHHRKQSRKESTCTVNQQILAAIKFGVSQNKVIWQLLNLASPRDPSMQCTIDVYVGDDKY